jgi:hypothetical protein
MVLGGASGCESLECGMAPWHRCTVGFEFIERIWLPPLPDGKPNHGFHRDRPRSNKQEFFGCRSVTWHLYLCIWVSQVDPGEEYPAELAHPEGPENLHGATRTARWHAEPENKEIEKFLLALDPMAAIDGSWGDSPARSRSNKREQSAPA